MIRRSTVVYIVILLVLAGVYYFLNNREQPQADIALTPELTEQVQYLFTADQGFPTDIRIESKSGETVEIARGADNAWALILPAEAKADQGSAEAAATQVTAMRVLDAVSDVDPAVLGLEQPEYLLSVKFNDGVERTIHIGVVTPSESGYYVQDAAGGEVQIVSKSSVDALLTLLTAPPYLETLTPSPAATETPAPSTTPEPGPPANETATPTT